MDQEVLVSYVKAMKSGNLDVFNDFYELTKKPIYYNIFALAKSRENSEDLLHDTYLTFLKDLNKVDENKSILGYLMVISRNLSLDFIKKHKRIDYQNEEKIYQTHDKKNDIESNLLLDKIKVILNDNEFEIFTLHVLNDLTFKEIAKLKRRPLGTIQWSYSNAIKKIQKEVNYEKD